MTHITSYVLRKDLSFQYCGEQVHNFKTICARELLIFLTLKRVGIFFSKNYREAAIKLKKKKEPQFDQHTNYFVTLMGHFVQKYTMTECLGWIKKETKTPLKHCITLIGMNETTFHT